MFIIFKSTGLLFTSFLEPMNVFTRTASFFKTKFFKLKWLYGASPSKIVDGPLNHKSLSISSENRRPFLRFHLYQQSTSTYLWTSSTILLTKTFCFFPSLLSPRKIIIESHQQWADEMWINDDNSEWTCIITCDNVVPSFLAIPILGLTFVWWVKLET